MIIPQFVLLIWFGLGAITDAYYIGLTGQSETKSTTVKQSVYRLGLLLNTSITIYLLM